MLVLGFMFVLCGDSKCCLGVRSLTSLFGEVFHVLTHDVKTILVWIDKYRGWKRRVKRCGGRRRKREVGGEGDEKEEEGGERGGW